MRQRVGRVLVSAGKFAGPAPRLLNGAANFLTTGAELHAAGIVMPRPVQTRFQVFDEAIRVASAATRPLYLEFGVWRGESMAYWSQRLDVPDARFVGLDSFEGLPTQWTEAAGKGSFSTGGELPHFADPRVSLIKGWFDQTLPAFDPPEHDLLIVNIDCDLYSSAALVLSWAAALLKSGSLLYFDEFHDRLHEGRAFHEFRTQTDFRFEMLARTPGATNVLFRRL